MTVDLAQPGQIELAPAEAKAMVSEIIARYEPADEFDARSVLEKHPGLRHYPSVVVDLAYEEYCRRVDAGEATDPQQFAQRFPEIAAPLLKLLEVHEYLDEHPDAFGAVPAPEWPQAGDEVGGFVLVREIGRGGFSRVFLARETDLGDRQVVLKICIQANEEAARLGQLDHPHIVPVHSVQFDSYPPFTLICMPFLGSATLADVLADGFADPGNRPRVADIVATIDRIEGQVGGDRPRQASLSARSRRFALRRTYAEAIIQTGAEVCEALAYAHRLGICHCDVKPSNVLLTSDGRPLLLDFNLSMRNDGDSAVVGGTLPYMAPEQLQYLLGAGAKDGPEIDHRADLFALGVTLFQLLTGRMPFPTEDLPQDRKEAARRLLDRQQSWMSCRSKLERMVSPAVARLITSCMAFDRESRPSSAGQVASQLRVELGSVARARNWLRRHKRAAISMALVLLLAASAMGIGFASRAPLHIRQYELGVSYLDAGDFASAARCFEGALDVHSDFPEARLLHGWSNLLAAQNEPLDESKRAGLLRLAHELMATAASGSGSANRAPLHILQYELGESYLDAGDFASAARWFEGALEVQPDFPEALLMQGWSNLLAARNEHLDESKRDGLLQSAHDLFYKSRVDYPTPESHASLASCCAEMGGKFNTAARTNFRDAVEKGFTTYSVKNNLGYYERETNPDAASAHLEEAISIEPTLEAAHVNLCYAKCNSALQSIQGAKKSQRVGDDESARIKEQMARDHVQAARVQIKKMIDQFETRTAEREFDAARVYAMLANVMGRLPDDDAGQQEKELLELALQSSQLAISLDLEPSSLGQVADLAPKLNEDPEFEKLLKCPPPKVPAVLSRPLVDVYPDIRQRLGLTVPQRGLAALGGN
jgi:serine/threonine protein kinase/Tfp pilus assembly protein PilF